MSDTAPDRFDPHRYLRTALRWKWLLLAVVVAIPAAIYLISSNLPKTYEASTTLFVQTTSVASPEFGDQISVSTSSPEAVARLVQTSLVADAAAKHLEQRDEDGAAALSEVSAQLDPTIGPENATNFLTISARDEDPQQAADTADAFAHAIQAKRSKQVANAIDRTLEELAEEGDVIASLGASARLNLAEEIQRLRTLRTSQQGATQIVDPVRTPTSPISPQPVRNTVLGFIFAVLLAAGLLPLLERLDRKLRDPDELEEIAGAPMLAMVPSGAFPGQAPTPDVLEAFQTLRAGLTYFNVDRDLGSVVITSPGHGEGKTTVATNLALALAQDHRVILVDADLRRPRAARRLGVEASIGLDAVLLGERSAEEALVEVRGVGGGRLRVLPTVFSPPNPAVLLSSKRMLALLEELKGDSDIVVIDTPPLLVISDAIPLIKESDGVVLVARMDQTHRDALVKARNVATTAGGTVLGVVATGTRASGLYGYYLYGYDGHDDGSEAGRVASNGATTVNGGRGRRRLRRSGARQEQDEKN